MDGPAVLDSDFRYSDGRGNLLRGRTELSIARLLGFLGCDYTYGAQLDVRGKKVRVDFETDHGIIEVIDSDEDAAKFEMIRRESPGTRIIGIGRQKYAARTSEIGELASYGPDEDGQTGSIFIEDGSFSFDYAHVLPLVEKCSILHGHTSMVMVELVGAMRDGLLIDFGEAKRIIRSVIAEFDHKFFIGRDHIADDSGDHYRVSFEGPRGAFDLRVPKHTTYVLDGEATVENLASVIIRKLEAAMPDNVEAVGVYIYEGYNKGSHIISSARAR